MLMGHMAAGRCLCTCGWSRGWDTRVHVGIAAAAVLLGGSPRNLLMHPDPQVGLPSEQHGEIRG